ncbi:MAG: diaminopimelate decarboxylase LysA [Promethearchaeota archaeon CR_4]|nr:MAG: diaminopimelate decarboxylase LysA [Candidatus Lokiarchaeota archaeon CR_4]
MDLVDWLRLKNLEYKDKVLHSGQFSLKSLADKYGTPLYVINEDVIRKRYQALKTAFAKSVDAYRIHYAVKANASIAVLKILCQEQAYTDVVSPGELYLCLKAGFPPEKILYTGNNFTNEELRYAAETGVMINLDDSSQIDRFADICNKLNLKKSLVSFRVNPEFGAGHHEHTITGGKNVKFGILDEQITDAYTKAKKAGFQRFGVQMHVGSGVLEIPPFELAANRFIKIVEKIALKVGITFEFIDFGGGIGIPYRVDENPLDLDSYTRALVTPFKAFVAKGEVGKPIFCVEPGRYLASEAGQLLLQVNTIKKTPYKTFVGTNGGFNVLIRPMMYGSFHTILPVVRREVSPINADVVGQICETDNIGKDRELQGVHEGDYLAILDTGAYGYAMASEYNSRPLPSEVLIHGRTVDIVRERQSFEDLLRHQRIPPHLE